MTFLKGESAMRAGILLCLLIFFAAFPCRAQDLKPEPAKSPGNPAQVTSSGTEFSDEHEILMEKFTQRAGMSMSMLIRLARDMERLKKKIYGARLAQSYRNELNSLSEKLDVLESDIQKKSKEKKN